MAGRGDDKGGTSPLLEPLRSIRRRRGTATTAQTLGNIIVSIVGTGVLGLPFAFRNAGWLSASLALTFAALSTLYTMLLLVRCRDRLEEEDPAVEINTYGDLGGKALGEVGRYATEFLVVISQSGGAVAYLVFIGQNLQTLLPASSAATNITTPSFFIFALLLPAEIVLSFIKSLPSLAPFSAFADACNLLAMAIVIKTDIQLLFRGGAGGGIFSRRPAFAGGAAGLLFAMGVSVFCFEGFGVTLALESSMADPRRFSSVLSQAFAAITSVYVCFGFFGYFAYGDLTRDIVTLNLPHDWSAAVVKVGLCIALTFTFPIMMHPIHEIVEARLRTSGWSRKLFYGSRGTEYVAVHVSRSLLVVAVALVASVIPGFGAFISFVGGTVCALLSFVFPAWFHLILMGPSLDLRQKVIDYMIVIAGLAFAGYGTFNTVSGHSGG
ncbi:hypothetical protein QJS10_CPB19g01335 [Acorus calamus]|uniref:Amino acid transporter transmembrane domain-containing protein n=1 Tax=Acorus calamus TaxID=4465 RepID=A0AAV9CIQ5_ACOCL|nr:hypothetical protein QJS10_CPB19g01335 [Acorus calamus]